MIESIPASRCPACGLVTAPPARWCPRHPVEMAPTTVAGAGEILSFTTLHSPPEGFRAPLHIALVELEGGARFVCHGAETRGLKIGSTVAVEAVDAVYYFSHLGAVDRARLFWRRAGRAGDRVNAIARSLAKRVWKGTSRGAS
ncbi:MAG: hypothetical protein A3D33_10520 [Candidatus Rokubacteria bacterium RIFCSPHIGHO2_02_FULL_73_26]|nr:MAG: hypothetical protein A3D33_10520 [Candidatus Rokubacteria bacterium RIFCSPHIGHO2_02_FULL_73_26]OGL25362.1 MAG: hypothetical protein A3G44_06570 [Candidatus Rokubacteria bacterium RIFCSPLOWO2_12_FULL_73_47]